MQTVLYVYGLLTVVYFAFIWTDNVRVHDGKPSIKAAKWSYSDAWLMITGVVFFIYLSIEIFGNHTVNIHHKFSFWRYILPTAIGQNIGAVIMTLLVVCGRNGIDCRELGYQFNGRELFRGFLIGLPTSIVVTVFALIVYLTLYTILGHNMMMDFLEYNNKFNEANQIFQQLNTNAQYIAFVVMACVAAPIGEEYFFRGWLFNTVKFRSNNAILACVVSAVLFGCIHIAPFNVIVIIPLGIWLAWSYHKSGSIWRNIGIHSAYNLLGIAVSLISRSLGHNLDKVF